MNDHARNWMMTAILTAILGSGLLGCNDSTFTPDDIPSLAPGEITSGSSGPTSGSSGPTSGSSGPDELDACFEWRRLQVTESTPPCSVAFDASCSGGDIVEYRWFFSGGPPVPGGFPDAERTTTSPRTDYSWGTDVECMYFRPFERLVQLTVVDAEGGTASFEEVVVFETQFQRRPN